jgi:hypothetical protein
LQEFKNNLNSSISNNLVSNLTILSYNVVGELKGSENPENIMVVGGHLDS